MSLTIQHQSDASAAEWRRIWLACEHATFFHAPEWAETWEKYSRGQIRPAAKLIRFSDGREALLPLCHQSRMKGLLSCYVCSPEATYGGWISEQPLTTAHAVLLTRWLLEAEGKNLVWRLNPYDPLALQAAMICSVAARRDQTHAIRLGADPELLFKGFKKGTREDIRKAQKKGCIEVSAAESEEEWRAYHRVYQDSLARWGHSPDEGYRWELFDHLRRLDSPFVRLWIARYDGQVVSGELSFYAQHQSVSWHAATLKDYLRSGVSKYQSFEILKDCCARGLQWLDFNPSAGLDGVKELKESFRAEALPAPLVYVDTALKRVIRTCASALNVHSAKLSVERLDAPPPTNGADEDATAPPV